MVCNPAPAACGGDGQMCCGTACNPGLACTAGSCRMSTTGGMPTPCGDEMQTCCGGTACNSGLSCQRGACTRLSGGMPAPCGGSGETYLQAQVKLAPCEDASAQGWSVVPA